MDGSPIAPLWLVIPLAGVALLMQAGYLMALNEIPKGKIPPSRKRIRMATGWLSMFAIPLSGYGFGIASSQDPRAFVIVWMVVIGLIAMILFLAILDAMNTMRLHRRARTRFDSEWKEALGLEVQESLSNNGFDHVELSIRDQSHE